MKINDTRIIDLPDFQLYLQNIQQTVKGYPHLQLQLQSVQTLCQYHNFQLHNLPREETTTVSENFNRYLQETEKISVKGN